MTFDGYLTRLVNVPESSETIDLLIDFLNTVDIEAGTDVLGKPREYTAWAHERGQKPGSRALARKVRDGVRVSLRGAPEAQTTFVVPVQLGATPAVEPRNVAEAALAAAVELAAAGQWNRVKLCPADDCLEAFYDTSRNRSRIWCDMADCGNLTKVRNFRQRAALQG